MATSRRFLVSKTYGESSDCSSSKAFDEAMKIKPRSTFNKINIQAASTVSKWGKMTFTSTKISSVDHKLDSRKREFANEPEDPFSFEPEFSPCKIKRTEPAIPLLAKFSSSENTVVDVGRKVEVDEVLHPSNNIKITNTGNISLDTKRKFYKSKNSANNNTEIKLKIKLNQPLESSINEYSIDHDDSIELTSASHYNKVDHKPATNNNVYKYNPDRFVDQPKQKFTSPSSEDKTAIKKKCIDILLNEKIYETDCLIDDFETKDHSTRYSDKRSTTNTHKQSTKSHKHSNKHSTTGNSNIKHSATGNNYAHQKVIKNTNKNTVTNHKSADLNIKTDSTNKFADTKNTKNNTKFDKKVTDNVNNNVCTDINTYNNEKISYDEDVVKNLNDIEIDDDKNTVDNTLEPAKNLHQTHNGMNLHIMKDAPKKSLTTRKLLCSKSTSQKKAKYKYRMWHEDDNEKDDVIDEDVDEDFPVFKKPSSSTYSKTNCQKEEPCTQESNNQTQVVRDVKQAHECQESGETQEFEDDIEFIMDGLNPKQKLSIRCLSALSLLSKCTSSVFRMHLRAHGTLSQVFKSLSDAPDCPALSLCVACLFFLMSRDRLFVDMERSSYELMLKLLDVDDSISTSNKSSSTTTQISNTSTTQSNNNAPVKKALFFKSKHSKKSNANEDYDDVQRKVFNICCSSQHQQQQQQQQSSDKALFDLTLEQTMTSRIAMEALLRFSSRKDADVLRDDLRILGGFDRIIDATCLSIDEFDGYCDRKRTDAYDDDDGDDGEREDGGDGGEKDKKAVEVDGGLDIFNMKLMNKIENFFQVLANVTNLNEANQTHLIMHKSATIITHLERCLKRCVQYLKKAKFVEVNGKLDKECSGYIVYNLIISLLNVFINITHDNTCGSTKAGSSIQLVENLFTCLLTANQNLPACCQFDLIVLCLGLLINLVEHCRSNLRILLDIHLPHSSSPESSSLRALGNFFTYHYESARQFEEEHDAELEKEQQQQQQQQQRQFSIDNNNKNLLANNKLADCSGEWVESEMGVEWVSHHLNTNSNNNSYDDDEDNKNKSNNNNRIALVNNHAKRGRQIADGQNHRLNSLFSQDNDSINKALNKAGKHMEDSVVAAYVALLIGCIVQHDLDLAEQVRDTLPDYSFESLSRMLRKFYNFMNLTQGMRPSCDKSILQVLEVLDSC